jgi:hypothetical protein
MTQRTKRRGGKAQRLPPFLASQTAVSGVLTPLPLGVGSLLGSLVHGRLCDAAQHTDGPSNAERLPDGCRYLEADRVPKPEKRLGPLVSRR